METLEYENIEDMKEKKGKEKPDDSARYKSKKKKK